MENYGPEPITVHSHSELANLRQQRGLSLAERFCPAPGTDIDKAGVMNPKGYVDVYTLQAGAALMLRAAKADKGLSQEDIDKIIVNRTSRVLTTEESEQQIQMLIEAGDEELLRQQIAQRAEEAQALLDLAEQLLEQSQEDDDGRDSEKPVDA